LIVDQLYCRQIYDGRKYTHLCAEHKRPDNLITIMGPSKTESLSGYRLGAAFGTAAIIERMEKLQAIMALRCGGYNQAVFECWFKEPEEWLAARTETHRQIRDDLMAVINATEGVSARPTEGGSYLFVTLPELDVSLHEFIRIARVHAAVTVTPGMEFGPQFLHQFRINFSQDHDAAVDALKRLFKLMELYRK
ncbi:MAG: aminotransferase class I/II-fold pyridoxal phosphate-dependent enzyme, partial [Firmicutes bacterium]|nr:aminotransferase class I/II-fold pyridoxal phosphate-dependent enzyme [Bacillota bacterium]